MISLSFSLTTALAPVVAVEVLDPLEVADRHAAGVAQDVRDHERRRDLNRISSASGVVGPLAASAMSLGLDVARVARRDLVLEGGRDEDVAVDLEHLGVARCPSRPGSPGRCRAPASRR